MDGDSNRLLGFTQTLTTMSNGKVKSVVTAPVNYIVNANGSMTSDGLREFDYDAANRLAKVTVSKDGEAARVVYLTNAMGQRVFKSVTQAEQTLPNETTLDAGFIAWLKKSFGWLFTTPTPTGAGLGTAYVYGDGAIPAWAMLGEYDNGSAVGKGRTEYIWLPTQDGQAMPVGMYRNGKFYAVHADHLDTPRLITDEANKPVWQWPYSAFGNNTPTGVLQATPNPKQAITNQPVLLKASKPIEMNLRFPGQYYDAETGLFYNWHRHYCARCGRYIQSDLIGLDDGTNRFAYVSGRPLSNVDTNGLQAASAAAAAAGATGALGGMSGAGKDQSRLPADWAVPSPYLPTWNWNGITWPDWMESRSSEKDRATDVPSWSRQYARKSGETCDQYAKRILEEHYGCDDPRAKARGPGSEFSKIKKHCERGGK
ncbi:hypothetical protein GHT07_04995 [Caenimonas koreensis DSM 17982]|uniref:RHS repeat-associated core domain-containing protein n=1 Tax=Caenimonas koreensis DSM 17982 TaxID=1121255 RepID=A0A844AZZ4_9BURK|nr:RHS repeat-associated core domain-containing protein [Caenimonas koreensis]MRD46622.1 hypothetical protein [Caenimonas koreensis DSM 17982]